MRCVMYMAWCVRMCTTNFPSCRLKEFLLWLWCLLSLRYYQAIRPSTSHTRTHRMTHRHTSILERIRQRLGWAPNVYIRTATYHKYKCRSVHMNRNKNKFTAFKLARVFATKLLFSVCCVHLLCVFPRFPFSSSCFSPFARSFSVHFLFPSFPFLTVYYFRCHLPPMHDYDFVLHRVEMVSFIFIFVRLASELIRSFGIGNGGGRGGGGSDKVSDEDDDKVYVLYLSRIGEVILFHFFHRVERRAPHAWSMCKTDKRIPRTQNQNENDIVAFLLRPLCAYYSHTILLLFSVLFSIVYFCFLCFLFCGCRRRRHRRNYCFSRVCGPPIFRSLSTHSHKCMQ